MDRHPDHGGGRSAGARFDLRPANGIRRAGLLAVALLLPLRWADAQVSANPPAPTPAISPAPASADPSASEPDKAPKNKPLNGPYKFRQGKEPLTHAELEVLSRDVAYQACEIAEPGKRTWEPSLDKRMKENGLEILDCIDDKETGMQAIFLKDSNTGEYHVSFRGTDEDKDRGAWKTQGKRPFEASEAKLAEWAKIGGGRIRVSGHSLGGAEGQRFIAAFPDAVLDGVFFCSPGVERELADKVHSAGIRKPITYYLDTHDAVPCGGEELLPGRVFEPEHAAPADPDAELAHIYASHSEWILQGGRKIKEWGFAAWRKHRIDNSAISRAAVLHAKKKYAEAGPFVMNALEKMKEAEAARKKAEEKKVLDAKKAKPPIIREVPTTVRCHDKIRTTSGELLDPLPGHSYHRDASTGYLLPGP
ncbi:MAG: hypothetical protein AAB215_01775 [Planctomycetota bacterium]